MKRLSVAALAVAVVLAAFAAAVASGGPGISADEALVKLKQGNTRFVSGTLEHPNQNAARRQDTGTNGQHPFAVVLTCADSRVPPEVLFDQGLGDLFAVRVAGNVAATDEIGSIEYAVEHLGSPLVVVLGHTKCGAVTAVVKKEHVTDNIAKLVSPMAPAVAKVEKQYASADQQTVIAKAIEANVWQSMADMEAKSPLITQFKKEGKVTVIGAIYDVDTGTVRWLGTEPPKAAATE